MCCWVRLSRLWTPQEQPRRAQREWVEQLEADELTHIFDDLKAEAPGSWFMRMLLSSLNDEQKASLNINRDPFPLVGSSDFLAITAESTMPQAAFVTVNENERRR